MTNIFGLHTQPCKTTRYTMKLILMCVRWGRGGWGGGGGGGGGGKRAETKSDSLGLLSILPYLDFSVLKNDFSIFVKNQ